MDFQPAGSVTRMLDGLAAGESAAAQELWNRYFGRLVAVAQARLKTMPGGSQGEDVALSALKSVMIGMAVNRFPQLTDRTGLWPLLVTLATRKSIDQVRRQLAAKRSAAATMHRDDWQAIAGRDPSPEFAVEVADLLERLVRQTADPTLRVIAQRKLEGFTNEEIANELSITTRTVIRKLNRIRQEWEAAEEAGD